MSRTAAALLLLFFAAPAAAQDPRPADLVRPFDSHSLAQGRQEPAQEPPSEQPAPVEYAVKVTAVTPRTAASSSVLRHDLFASMFVESPADVLRAVPGLVVAQHAGGGKSDQYLIRGFDADHGSDVLLSVDGVPANMVSHAHGQGYADLHWVIPETVERFDVHKGPFASRLRHESVDDVHFTPGNPRALRIGREYRFDWR